MECLPNLHDTVRVFTSSTFTDTAAERNFLMERVFPVLVDMCRQEGVSFHAVDLRWGEACTACAGVAVWRMTFRFGLGLCAGIRDEATDDQKTAEICMSEIEKCARTSIGPMFVHFSTNKVCDSLSRTDVAFSAHC